MSTDDSHLTEQPTGQSTVLHRGWLELRRDTVRLPDGSQATREYIRHSGAVAVVEGFIDLLILSRTQLLPSVFVSSARPCKRMRI